MKWLEVIRLRSAGKSRGLLKELLESLGQMKQDGLVEMRTYHHGALETDVALHLHWESKRPEKNGSSLGIRLAQGLKEFGLTDHSVWIEEKA